MLVSVYRKSAQAVTFLETHFLCIFTPGKKILQVLFVMVTGEM